MGGSTYLLVLVRFNPRKRREVGRRLAAVTGVAVVSFAGDAALLSIGGSSRAVSRDQIASWPEVEQLVRLGGRPPCPAADA